MSDEVLFCNIPALAPPYVSDKGFIYGQSSQGFYDVVAIMHDYHSVSAEEQRRMVENTIALCEMLYEQQQLSSTN